VNAENQWRTEPDPTPLPPSNASSVAWRKKPGPTFSALTPRGSSTGRFPPTSH